MLLTLTYFDKPSSFFWNERDFLNKTGGNVFCLLLINEEKYLRDLLNSALAEAWFHFQLTWLACWDTSPSYSTATVGNVVESCLIVCGSLDHHLPVFVVPSQPAPLVLSGPWSSCGTVGPARNSWGRLRLFCSLRSNYHHWQTRLDCYKNIFFSP